VRVEPSSAVVAATASQAGDRVCRAELVMILREAEPGWADAIASARTRVAAWRG
jgi:hypothetical protein